MNNKILIIGLGSSGLFLYSLLNGKAMAVEQNQEAGLKLLITGGGRCNFSPSFDEISSHYYDKKNFVSPSVSAFPPSRIRSYFENLGVRTGKEGQKLFPESGKSSDIRDALLKNGENIKYGEKAILVEKRGNLFHVTTDKASYASEIAVIATGGITYPKTGSDGSLYPAIRKLGHTVIEPKPALAELMLENHRLRKAEGVSLKLALRKGKAYAEGDAVITGNGISGPVAENFSHYVDKGSEIEVSILKIRKEDLEKYSQKAMLKNALPLPERLTTSLFPSLAGKKLNELKKAEKEEIVKTLNSFRTKASPNARNAMCTRGGVSTDEINRKTMESRLISNLYFTGEAIDVDGECGGFNLAFAFSSAYLAYQDILKKS